MPNLTESEKIVIQKGGEITIEPGYDLVVKEEENYNLYLEGQLPPKKGWFSTKKNKPIEVYGISKDTRHNVSFKRAVAHSDGVHHFFVTIDLRFGVGDPITIVRNFRHDPVEKLKEEAGKVIGGFLKASGWDEIKNPNKFRNLKIGALETEIFTGRGEMISLFDRIGMHAENYGLKVFEINFDIILNEKDLQVEIKKDENEAAKLISDSDIDKDLHVTKNDQQLTVLNNNFRRNEQMKEQLAKTAENFIDRAGANLAESSRSIEDVKRILAGAREIQNEIRNDTIGTQNFGHASSTKALGAGNSFLGSLQDVLTEVKLANLDLNTQKQVLGALFHMVGGKLLNESQEDLTAYALNLDGIELPGDLQDYLKVKWTEVKNRIDNNNLM